MYEVSHMRETLVPNVDEIKCWLCDSLWPRLENEDAADWLCSPCFHRACKEAHFITEMAEDIARQLMEIDWHTRPGTVMRLNKIRDAIVRAGTLQEEVFADVVGDEDPF